MFWLEEVAAMTMIDADCAIIHRKVIGKESSHQDDISSGLLEYPLSLYDYRGMVVPDIAHEWAPWKFASGGCMRSLKKTYERRPDLLKTINWLAEEEKMLPEIKNKE